MRTAARLKAWALVGALLVSSSVIGQTHPKLAVAQDPELQLRAIRQAIVGAMEGSPTRVLSTAWVDEKGALHETTVYNTDAQLKGVRVLAYINDGQETRDQQAARLAADVALPHYLKKPASEKACHEAGASYRMPLNVERLVRAGSGELDTAVAAWLDKELMEFIPALSSQSVRWYAIPAARMESSQKPPGNYWASLLGRASESSEWTLRVQLQRMPRANQDLEGTPAKTPEFLRTWLGQPAPQRWTLKLSLSETAEKPVWQWQAEVENVPQESGHAAAGMLKDLHRQLTRAVHDLDEATACTPMKYTLRKPQVAGERDWVLNAGARTHLKSGDRLIVLDRQSLPSRMLEAGAMERLGLAEVVRVDGRQTQLRQLAGPPLTVQGDWIAMPL